MTKTLSIGTFDTTGTAVQAKTFDVTQNLHEDLLLGVEQINDPDIPLRHVSDSHVLSLAQSVLAYGFLHKRRTLSVITPSMANCSEAREGALIGTFRFLEKAASVVLVN